MELPVSSSDETNQHFIDFSDSFEEGSKVYWIGINKQVVGDVTQWVNTYTGDVINGFGGGDGMYSKWSNMGQPAGEGFFAKTKTNGKWLNDDGSSECTTICTSVECTTGYATDGSDATVYGGCEDIDECADHIDTCHDNSICSNFPGSYDCLCDLIGYVYFGPVDGCQFQNGSCDEDNVCTCYPGYEDQAGWCVDIDECATGTHVCGAFRTPSAFANIGYCFNTDGSHYCEFDCDGRVFRYDTGPVDEDGAAVRLNFDAALNYCETRNLELPTTIDDNFSFCLIEMSKESQFWLGVSDAQDKVQSIV